MDHEGLNVFYYMYVQGIFLLVLVGYVLFVLLKIVIRRRRLKLRSMLRDAVLFVILLIANACLFYVKECSYLNSVIFTHQTSIGPGYSDIKFKQVKIGESMQSVMRIIGPPLKRIILEDGSQLWQYTKCGPDDTHYFQREILIGTDGKIKKIVSFYVD